MKHISKDFKCGCGCGQRLRIIHYFTKQVHLIDFGILQPKETRPKVGIVLRSDEKGFKEFIKFINKKK